MTTPKRKGTDYARKCIRNNQLLEQTLLGHRICVKYQNKDDIDEYTISWPKNIDKSFNTLNQVSAFHAKMVGLTSVPNPWKTFKINCWVSGLSIYPSCSIDNLPPLSKDIIEKQEKQKMAAKEYEKKKKLKENERKKREEERKKREDAIIVEKAIAKAKTLFISLIKHQRAKSSSTTSFMILNKIRI